MKNRMTMMMAAIALSASGLYAQNFGEIHGRIFDEKHQPLLFTGVYAEQGEKRFATTTDEEGRFVLKPLPPGAYAVHVRTMSNEYVEEGVLVSADKLTRLDDITINATEVLPDVVVARKTWMPKLIDIDNPVVTSLFHTQFKRNPQRKNPVNLIVTVSPGVYKGPNGDGLFFRGSRSDNMCYYVDGMKLGDRLSGVPSEAINGMNVYTGGLPAKYGDVTGGVVAIETKSYFDLYEQRNAGIK